MLRSARALAVMLTIIMLASVLPISNCCGEPDNANDSIPANSTASDLTVFKEGLAITLHRLTSDDVAAMRATMGVKDPDHDYNTMVDGMGTGLAPPSDSEYDLMVGQYATVKVEIGDLGGGSLPSSYDLSALSTFPKVGNQGSQGSCAAWAMTYYCYGFIESADNGWTSAKSGSTSQLLSPAWTYNRVNDYDQGSSMAGNGWVIEDWGVPTLAAMPYNAADCTSWGNEIAMRDAPLHRASSVRIASDYSTDAIKAIVQSGKPITFALDANQYSACFSDNGASKIISASEYDSSKAINHAQTIVGWNDSVSDDGEMGAFRIVNSWGTGWGESGYYWITYSAFAEMAPGYNPVYIDDMVDYSPSLMAAWHYDTAPGRDTTFTLKLLDNNTGSTMASKAFYHRNSYANGAIPKHPNFIAVDISDFASSYSATNCKFSIEFSGGASAGTISSFRVERYDGSYSAGQATHISRQASGLPKSTSGAITTFMAPYSKLSYADALDSTGVTFTSTGSARWVPEVHQSMNGNDALQSGDIPDGQTSRLSTTVTGACNLEFDWRSSSESGDNYAYSLDGTVQSTITGSTSWAHVKLVIPSGSHSVEWTFTKGSSISRLDDCAYLDKVYLSSDGGGDITPPQTSVSLAGTTGNNGWYRSSVTVTLSASDSSGINGTYYRLDGGSWQTYAAPFTISTEGTTQISYYSIDAAGNTESTITTSAKVDKTAPSTSSSINSYQVTLTPTDLTSGVYRTFYRLDFGAWALYSIPFSAGSSGEHMVEFNSTDNAGNIESTRQIAVGAADSTPPTTTASLAGTTGQNGWYVTSVTVTLTATDNVGVASRHYRVDSGSWTTYTAAFTVSTDGSHTVEFYSVDTTGNTEGAKSVSFKIDSTKPSTISTVSSYTVTLTASDATSGVLRTFYRIDSGAWILYGAPFSAGTSGQHNVQFNSTDNAGNVETTKQTTVGSSDSTPPTTTASLAGTTGQNGWYVTSVTVTLTATDNVGVASRNYRIDSGSWTAYSSSFSVSTDGSHTVEFYSVDTTGNTEGAKSVSFKIDSTKPSTISTVSSYTVTLTASDATSGVNASYYRVGGSGAYLLYTTPFSAGTPGQVYTVYYYSIDRASNIESTKTVQVGTADTTPPSTSATLSGTLGGAGWYLSAVTISLSATDNVAVQSTYYRWQGASSWSTYSSSFSTSTEGDRVLEYYSVDTNSNIESTKSLHVKIDRTAPTSISSVAGSTVTLSSSDARSGPSYIQYRVDSGSWTTYTGPFSVIPIWVAHTVEYRAVDVAGNMEGIRSQKVGSNDGTAPSTSAVLTGPAGSAGWYLGGISIALTASDSASGPNQTWASLDGGSWFRYTGPLAVSGEGMHQLLYYSIDLAGNVESQRSLQTGIDSFAPACTPKVGNGMVSFTGSDATSGLAVIYYHLDSSPDMVYGGLVTIPEPYQAHTLYYHAVDVAGNLQVQKSVFIPASDDTDLLPPGPPSDLQANSSEGVVRFSWKAPDHDGGSAILGYKVFRGTITGGETYLTYTTSLQYTDTSVPLGTTHYYVIKANNSVGDSIASEEVSVLLATLPSAPLDLTIEYTLGKVDITWASPLTDGGLPISSYVLVRSIATGGPVVTITLPSTARSYLDSEVEAGLTYHYRVHAVNALGEGPESAEGSISVPYQMGQPLSLSVQLKNGMARLSWFAPQGSVPTGYRVFRSLEAGHPETLSDITGLSYDDALPSGQTYYYSVAALYGNQVGPRSGELSVTLAEDGPELPSTPEGLSGMAAPEGLNLNWTYTFADRDTLIGFNIYRSLEANMSYAVLLDMVNTTVYLDGSALPGVTYHYQVRALNQGGVGPASAVASASRPLDAGSLPGAPSGLQASVEGAKIFLSWTVPSQPGSAGLLGYRLYRSGDSGTPRLLATVNGPSFEDRTALPEHPYQYWVSAYNAMGESAMTAPTAASRDKLALDDPLMPQDLTARYLLGQVELSWEVPAAIPLQYLLYRGSGPQDMVLIAVLDGDVHSYVDQESWDGAYYAIAAEFDDGIGPITPLTVADGASYESDLPGAGASPLANPLVWMALVGAFVVGFVIIRSVNRRRK